MSVVTIPMLCLKPEWVEHVALRIFAKVGNSSRPKARTEIVGFHRLRGVSKAAAEADADRTMAYIEVRIAMYRAASLAPIDVSPRSSRRSRAGGR